jgi:hypothetical protein
MMKLIPIRAVAERLGLSYDQIALDPILKTVKKDGRDYILSASLTCFKKNEMRVRRLAARPSKVFGGGRVSRIFRVFGSSRVIERETNA